jgi:hypothetical protein
MIDGENPAIVDMHPLIVLIHHGSAHHVGAVHLSTEDLELQVERLLEVRQAAATFLDRNELSFPRIQTSSPRRSRERRSLSGPSTVTSWRVIPTDSGGSS